uniref:LON peptidase N-terminal domain and RING finger protein n=1 Tax=Sparassis latifolia TaxID=1202976 RepID=A0A6B9LS86_9APHY|nr:LON peptidase N-terminal domain and RING finger protein [Sparassis latifolia]
MSRIADKGKARARDDDEDNPGQPSRRSPPAPEPGRSPSLRRHPPSPDAILPLLHCPQCSPSRLLHAPLTLRCGHTLCSQHILSPPTSSPSPSNPLSALYQGSAPSCPLPTCNAPSSETPTTTTTTTSSPGVHFSPAPVSSSRPSTPVSRVDVSVNKIISLVVRAHNNTDPDASATVRTYPADIDDQTDDSDAADDLDEHPLPSTDAVSDPDRHSGLGPAAPASSHPRPQSPPRSRKRRRGPRPRHRPHDHPPSPSSDPAARFEKELLTELTCEICFALLWQPVTTPCQHTFCSPCLARALDHNLACPLCRQILPGYDYFQEHPCNKLVLSILLRAFPEAYAERGAALEAEARDSRLDTPLFVCQLSFPGMPTILHFFEPRYRLMLRRCLAAPYPAFGMVPPPRASAGVVEFGTMLEIRNVQMLPDGRSVVETWGVWRFRVMERGTLDGYGVARVERVEDWEEDDEEAVLDVRPVASGEEGSGTPGPSSSSSVASMSTSPPLSEPPGSALTSVGPSTIPRSAPTNVELMAICHEFLEYLREGTPWVVQHLNTSYVPMPADPAAFSFWIGMVVLWWLRRLVMRLYFSRAAGPYACVVALLAFAVYSIQGG